MGRTLEEYSSLFLLKNERACCWPQNRTVMVISNGPVWEEIRAMKHWWSSFSLSLWVCVYALDGQSFGQPSSIQFSDLGRE